MKDIRKTLLRLQSRANDLRNRWNNPSHPGNIIGSEAEELESLIDEVNRLSFDIKTPRPLLPPILPLPQGRIYNFEQAKTAVERIYGDTKTEIGIIDEERRELRLKEQRNIFFYLWLITLLWVAIHIFLSKHSANLSENYVNILRKIQNVIPWSSLLAVLKRVIRWFKKKFGRGR
ncbi:MAG: hypothetical protein KAX20_03000 [Candidatus Omnitrophica bacterium]|nr:hypothetical protein [Candidatus Omnitrophota bacterium]